MTAATPHSLADERRYAEAAAWRARMAEQGLDRCEELDQWLAASPLNAQAYDLAEATWDEVGEVSTTPELMDVRRRALEVAARQGRRNRGAYAWTRQIAAGLVAVMVMAAGGGTYWLATRPQIYETQFGERRVVPLADGSRVSLDSDSKVAVRFTADARKLELLRGQARFDVAHNVQRPFSVRAREETVVATGTAFNIDLLGPRTLVTLIEGHVVILKTRKTGAVAQRFARAESVSLDPGQELVATPSAPPVIRRASLEQTTAWQDGRLVFDNEPLATVAARVSRYSGRPVTVDASAADLKISGVFNAGDSDGFVEAMTNYLPVRSMARPDGGTVLVHR
jgi:transmembrane sensor